MTGEPTRSELLHALTKRQPRGRKVVEDGIRFDSGIERDRYRELKMLQRAGEISRLQCHPEFVFIVNGVRVGSLKPDFQYLDKQNRVVVEDKKAWKVSPKTGKAHPVLNREWTLKTKLMLALFNIEVVLV